MGGIVDLLFGKADKDVTPPKPPADIDREGGKAAERERLRRRRARGRGSTILTGGDLGQANVGRQTLGGR